jgi:hypothetical protein
VTTAEFGGGENPDPPQPEKPWPPAPAVKPVFVTPAPQVVPVPTAPYYPGFPVLPAPPMRAAPPPVQPGPPVASAPPAPPAPGSLPAGVPVYRTPVYGAPYPPQLTGSGYAYPFIPAPPIRPRRPLWLGWLAVVVVLLVVGTMSAGGGLLAGVLTGHTENGGTWNAARNQPDVGTAPAAGAPMTEWSAWALKSAQGELAAQTHALMSGDESGFLAVADPANTPLVRTLRTRFTNLRAMGLGAWSQWLGDLRPGGDKIWTGNILIKYCFGGPDCPRAALLEKTRWSVSGDRLVLSKLDPASADDNGPRPWETDALTIKTGERVVVAATKVNAWRVPAAVAVADRAAAITDTFAKWEPPPSRYVIFFAGPNDWRRWYGMDEPEWAAAWSVPVARSVTEIVVRSDVVAQSDLPVLLTHEMTHVATLAGPRDGATLQAWWLIEGIAEYASHLNVALRDYDGVDPTVRYVRTQWDGNPAVAAPGQSASPVEAGGKYGVAFLSVRRIAERYSKAKMLDFWGRVVHDDETLDHAARAALGISWSTVKADCSRYVKEQVAAV